MGLKDVAEIAAGGLHACARLTDGTVKCWGNNTVGQLGDGTKTNRGSPTSVPALSDVVQIALGSSQSSHSCALIKGGSVKCWGRNKLGQLGDGTTTDHATPTPVPGISGAAGIGLNTGHTCARFTDGTTKCWGSNMFGQLGDGTSTDRPTPATVSGLAKVAEIAVGAGHTCARRSDGSVACWGGNQNGQLGVAASQACDGGTCAFSPVEVK